MNVVKLIGTSWLIHDGQRGIIVDAARKRNKAAIKSKLDALGLSIPLLFLTHTHFDHTGCAQALHQYTGAKVIVGAAEAQCLKQGLTPVPKGTYALTRFISKAGHKLVPRETEHYGAITRDIVTVSEILDLSEFGFEARAIPLGAHTAGSIGLHFGDYFFAGDTVFGLDISLYPPFADQPERIGAAWRKILESGAAWICPGHGPVLPRDRLEKKYAYFFEK